MRSVLSIHLKNWNYLQAKVSGAATRTKVHSHPFHRSVGFVVTASPWLHMYATSSLAKHNVIHFPPGLMILNTYLSIVVFPTLMAKAGFRSHRGKGISSKCLTEVSGAVIQKYGPIPQIGGFRSIFSIQMTEKTGSSTLA